MASDHNSLGRQDSAFQRFVAAACAEVRAAPNDRERIAGISELLRPLLRDWRVRDLRYEQPQTGMPYGSYLLYLHPDESLCVVQDVFMPGQDTGIHEHGGTWGVVGVVRGMEREHRYTADATAQEPPRELDCTVHRPGEIATVMPFEQEFHAIECASDEPSVSLHIYGADIGRLQRRMWDADAERFVAFSSGYSNEAEALPIYLDAAELGY